MCQLALVLAAGMPLGSGWRRIGFPPELRDFSSALDHVTAAGFPVVAVTAWQMLFEYARIEAGQAILVRGAAGSVGAFATQMAKEAGASVYGTARTRDIDADSGGSRPLIPE